jgi:hypothetical protein
MIGRPLLVATAAVALLGGTAEARVLAFKSPSGNVTCVMSTAGGGFAQCELRSMPRRGGFLVPRSGRVSRYDVAGFDDLSGRRFVLGYGQSRSLTRFTCTSRASGMTCRNRVTRHGFTISRQRRRVF